MTNKLTDEEITELALKLFDGSSFYFQSGQRPGAKTMAELLNKAACAVAELQERRKADNQEPAGYHVIKECGKVGCSVATLEEAEKTRDFWNKKWTIRPYFYSAQPVQETGVYNDVLNIIGLLENNEWAEHCASTVLGSLLESEITRLVGKEQSVPVVPEEMPKGLAGQVVSLLAHNIGDKFLAQKIWNACRAALLNGDIFRENSISSTNNFREIAETSTNSPVIPGGWISCSERMPEDEQEVIVHNKLGYRYVSYFDEHSGLFFDMRGGNQMNCIEHLLVTHWRPMPAPPQQ